MQEFT